MKTNWSGVFAIPATPWDEKDRLDEETLAREVDWLAGNGVRGIIGPILVSEFQALSVAERKQFVRVMTQTNKNRLPVIANVAATNTPEAVAYAEFACECGVDGVIAMPPYALFGDYERVHAYFKAINDVVNIPIMLQNAPVSPLAPDNVIRLCNELEHVKWVKEEVPPNPRSVGNLIARNNPNVHGVMGGVGGLYLFTEFDRGAVGTIIAPEICDVVQRIWDMLEAGKRDEAGDLFERVVTIIAYEALFGMAFAKEILVRRGVLKNNRMRMQTRPLDAHDMREIDRLWERVKGLL
jgi:4-hydroxy-tetrahydrodipicolinate synthase